MRVHLNLAGAEWIKSSYSEATGGQCVEFSRSFAELGAVPVRDSKVPHGSALIFSTGGWQGFIRAVKHSDVRA
ncbi:DUF397 domain-containing protein [Streptomyces sp. RFCAC02]|uniref:DUF397 domain-containing protein n=1 Tax=Streptomyces sp. RFCAC02 TaxID=2499143 RepID=UPI001021F304|nr:DUF397 domain-containing protein [Streptomyces sp. RFCAC02]